MKRFEGKAALVVGAATGIGAATAERLARDGASVVLTDIDMPAAEERAGAIRAAGGTAIALLGNLADEATLKSAIDQTCTNYGGLDFLVNVGFMKSADDRTVTDTPQELWDRMMDVNLMGFVRSCRHAIPRMVDRGGGSIVNLTTGSDRLSEPRRVVYGVSKAAIQALTRHIAVTYGPQGIRANSVAPGLTLTANVLKSMPADSVERWSAISPQRRPAQPEEVAAAIAFLLSDDASHISGEVIRTDGGRGINAG
jgi:NAD(P)-dependent dehydrogenase (short-subunit alcohol dehydrogenase family)